MTTVTWRPSRSLNVAAYEIWKSPAPGGPYYLLADSSLEARVEGRNASRHTLPNLHPGRYYFVMTSLDRRGNRSLRSNEVETKI